MQQDNQKEQRTSKEAGYRLVAQAEEMELITKDFANFVTNKRSNQTLALAAAAKEKLASDTNKIALQNITNQYLQLATKFDGTMAKMRSTTANLLQATMPCKRKPSSDHGSYCWSHGFHVATVHTSVSCQTPRSGHQVAATQQNTMGGQPTGKPHNSTARSKQNSWN
jgi:hypothetical protein